MCRHLACVDPAVAPAHAVLDAPHALANQVRSPRHQAAGITNTDGWGVVTWPGPVQHRSTTALADDPGASSVLPTTATAFVAAVRRATEGAPPSPEGNAPFVAGGLAFSLNGFLGGFAHGAGAALRRAVSAARLDGVHPDADSEVLFALVLDRLDEGLDPAAALAATVEHALAAASGPSRLNLLLGDGTTIWATRHVNSLFVRPGAVASEPWDDDPAWEAVADGSVVTVDAGRVAVRALERG